MNRTAYKKGIAEELFSLRLSLEEWKKAKDKGFLQLHKTVTLEEYEKLTAKAIFPVKTHCYTEIEEEGIEVFDTIHVINMTREHSELSIKNYEKGEPFEISINYDFSHWYTEKYTEKEDEFCVRLKIAYNKG